MQRYEGGNNPGNDASGEDNRTKAPKILHKSSKELYRAVAKQWGITCKMSDHCRCLDCQVSVPLHRCNIEYFIFSTEHFAAFFQCIALQNSSLVLSNTPSFQKYLPIQNLNLLSRKVRRARDFNRSCLRYKNRSCVE